MDKTKTLYSRVFLTISSFSDLKICLCVNAVLHRKGFVKKKNHVHVDKTRTSFIVSSSCYCLYTWVCFGSTKRLFSCLFKTIIIFFHDIVWLETMQYLDMTNFTSCPLSDTFILVFIAQSSLCVFSLAGKRSIPQKQKTSKQTSSIQWRS